MKKLDIVQMSDVEPKENAYTKYSRGDGKGGRHYESCLRRIEASNSIFYDGAFISKQQARDIVENKKTASYWGAPGIGLILHSDPHSEVGVSE